jgi:amino acid transporter
MISIDFSLAVALFNFVFLAVLLIFWVFSRKQKDKDLNLNPKFIWFCSICAYTYINTKEDIISLCPRCGNYNKK